MIVVENYGKTYKDIVAASGIHFQVNPGEILGLVGPNGAGKTTTLRAICGIIQPTEGSISVAGHDIVKDPVEAKKKLAFIPDDPNLFDSLTVWEHLYFMASCYHVENFEDKAERLLEMFDLSEKRHTLARELSRGMKQKVAIGCAYIHDPKAILFDEPLTGLDPKAIRTLKKTIVEYAEAGSAIIISSHLLSLVEDLCTNLLIMHQGACLFFGPIEQAHRQFGKEDADSSLEELFFRATEGESADALSSQNAPGDQGR
ncbi:MAG: ABC transporter ATP-binding protein [Candidatus Omnitrophica bacterium]|nr:ABC transporter ATP-binding protein [Candidatus Omnitrophota bacterium]